MAHIFRKEFPKVCYGPEVMHYPTFIGINEWGEVEFESDDVKPCITDYCDYDEKPPQHGFSHAHQEKGMISNPWERAMFGPEPDDGRERGGDS